MFCFLEQDLQFIYTHQRCVLFGAEGSVRGQAGSATHNKWEDSTCSLAEKNDQDIGLTADDGLRFYWHFFLSSLNLGLVLDRLPS